MRSIQDWPALFRLFGAFRSVLSLLLPQVVLAGSASQEWLRSGRLAKAMLQKQCALHWTREKIW